MAIFLILWHLFSLVWRVNKGLNWNLCSIVYTCIPQLSQTATAVHAHMHTHMAAMLWESGYVTYSKQREAGAGTLSRVDTKRGEVAQSASAVKYSTVYYSMVLTPLCLGHIWRKRPNTETAGLCVDETRQEH